MGPLEATIRNLSKQIAAKVESSERLQQEWLRDQTTMVAVANVVEEQVEKVGGAPRSPHGTVSSSQVLLS